MRPPRIKELKKSSLTNDLFCCIRYAIFSQIVQEIAPY